jgi:hypothetical protein
METIEMEKFPWFEPKIHNFQNSKNISCALPSSLFLILKKNKLFWYNNKKEKISLAKRGNAASSGVLFQIPHYYRKFLYCKPKMLCT